MKKELLGVGDRLIGVTTPAGDHYRVGGRGVLSIGVSELPGPMGFYLVANIIYEDGRPDVILPLHAAQEIHVSKSTIGNDMNTDISRLRFGPTPWTCSSCGTENEMSRQVCKECERDPRTTLTDGTQVYPGHRNLKANGQQEDYVVLAEEERAKGFVRPVRRSYKHLKCGTVTTMGQSLAETYARNPGFYSGTFCCGCSAHFPVGADGEFVWDGSNEKVGT